jgi:signal transduction histidine kinase/DNA-binding response OmpR family regulator
MSQTITTVQIKYEDDVVTARQRARQVARILTFDEQDQTRLSTAVSEVARIIVNDKSPGVVEFSLEGETAPQVLIVGIGSPTSLSKLTKTVGIGTNSIVDEWETAMLSARRLMDQCEMGHVSDRGTTIRLKKLLPKRAPLFTRKTLDRLVKQIESQVQLSPMEEVRQQNHELLRAMEELHERQQELVRLNRELEDTNRGVVALYAELDEKAGHLRRADEMKSRFLSNMSHEFRTPVNAILALSQLLLDRADGELTGEQEKQVTYIQKSGSDLLELVNDLLDLAKIEAGKIEIRPAVFEVSTLFSALRGMLRPLLLSRTVNLVFEEPKGIPMMKTDEGKVSQILRNFISNAIKFTEQGEVKIVASLSDDGQSMTFKVSDTGIGIAEEDQRRIFDEWSQIDNPIQRKVKGTGLGLPLCQKLAHLLGGSINVTSRLGVGSAFEATIPIVYAHAEQDDLVTVDQLQSQPDADHLYVLVVEDEPGARLLYDTYLRGTMFQPIAAGSIRQARESLQRHQVAAIVLDVLLPGETAWQWLAELKDQPATRDIPVLVVSSVDDPRKALALGADDYCLKPVERAWLLNRLERVISERRNSVRGVQPVVLLIDDQEADRYILHRQITEVGCSVVEAASGEEGLRLAAELKPDMILLDLNMPGMDGFCVLEQLNQNSHTAAIPVVIVTSQILPPERRAALAGSRAMIVKHESTTTAWLQLFREIGLISHLAKAVGGYRAVG